MKRIATNGIELAVTDVGEGPAIVFCHGWPELAHSWTHQIEAVTASGFRAIAPDMRGFGNSDAPADTDAYGITDITDDLAGLLDALDLETATFIGHDWGGAAVWVMAQRYPDRVSAVASLNTPHYPQAPAPPIDIMRQRHGPDHYWVHFQEEGPAEKLFASDVDRFFRSTFRTPPSKESVEAFRAAGRPVNLKASFNAGPAGGDLVMSEDDLAVYVAAYQKSGFRGGLNLYRNMDRNWSEAAELDPIIRHPALMVSAELDLMLPPEHADWMRSVMPNLEYHVLEGVGHWTQWEATDRINEILVSWLNRLA